MPASIAWKPWYAAEARSDAGREAVRRAVEAARADPTTDALRESLARGGVVSFPHTTLSGSALPLARAATAIVAGAFDEVLALGVLHASSLPEALRPLARAAAAGDRDALARVGGAFVAAGDADTPHGTVRGGTAPSSSRWLRPDAGVVAGEFSLDLFLAVLAAVARASGRAPPPVTRVFVGTTRAAGDDLAIASEIADGLRPLLRPSSARVATGDLVHAGNGYSDPADVAALPSDPDSLRARFEARVRAMLAGAFAGGDAARRADAESLALRNDQRHLLPVLASLLGEGARPRLVSFELTDYGSILREPPPCVVASALVSIEPRAPRARSR